MPANGQILCTMEGYERSVTIELPEPFTGTTVRDVAGYVHFVAPPDGLVDLRGLPEEWDLRAERSVGESPTGRWQRTFGRTADANGRAPILDVYQAFGGPAQVTGGEETRSVAVGDTPAILYRHPESHELVLVWSLGPDGLALVADERDFDDDALIRLAESAGR